VSTSAGVRLLGGGDVRAIAARLNVQPTKKLGQNFVVEPGTVRQVAGIAAPFTADDVVLEVGPGLGSLTLALLEAVAPVGARVVAVEIDPVLAAELPKTIAERAPAVADRVTVIQADALTLGSARTPGGIDGDPREPGDAVARRERAPASELGASGQARRSRAKREDPRGAGRSYGAQHVQAGEPGGIQAGPGALYPPSAIVANLPYNVAVPVVLTLLAAFPSIARGVVMVQAEVADRMCAGPGSRVYGAPSAKLAWYAAARLAGTVPRSVFWPVPNVDSKLVAFARRQAPEGEASREETFSVIDAAFGQRRKTLRAALATWAGSPARAEDVLRAAGVDPGARGEALGIAQFARIAAAARAPEAGNIRRS
jgi:16S rRNA (adenine1518-N6/adenine1519-N6)-dimethyltransferase